MSTDVHTTTATPTKLRVDMMRGPRVASIVLLLVVVALFGTILFWSSQAELDEVAAGMGRVIPSSEIQVVQNLEGGIVQDILVREGQTVEKDQILLRIDDTSASASAGATMQTYAGFNAAVIRLTAEAEGIALAWPEALKRDRPDLVARETDLYNTRQQELKSSIGILRQQRTQRARELEEQRSSLQGLQLSYEFVAEEYKLTEPLVEKGSVSKVEFLQLKRQLNDLESQINTTRIASKRTQSAIAEADSRIKERRQNFRSTALAELNDRKTRLNALAEELRSQEDRVTRTEVRSPVRGIVKQLHFNTVNGVVQPGEDMVEIVPLDDTLLVEAEINPRDVAFLFPGQEAKVKLTAYDFSIYGGLDAKLEQISADTITDEEGNSFYQIRVRTEDSHLLGKDGEPLPIITGMVAEVDILTGKKTVLDYMLKPFIKARHKALRER